MVAHVKEELERRLAEAEQAGRWLVPHDHAEELALRRRVAAGDLMTPFPGCFARADRYAALPSRQKAHADICTLAARHPDWVFCRYSAAVVYGLWVPNSLLGNMHIVRPGGYGRAGSRVIRHKMTLRAGDIEVHRGIRVTSIERTLLDCLSAVEFTRALAIADSALHWGLADESGIARYLNRQRSGCRGIKRARKTWAQADGRSGSGGESFARATMIELGFQVPDLQVEMFDPLEPGNPKFADFGWLLSEERPIIGELDGMEKYKGTMPGRAESLDQVVCAMSRERRREAHLNLTDVKVIRFSVEDVRDTGYFERLLSLAGVPRAAESETLS